MSKKNIIVAARIASMLLTPFYLPTMGIIILLFFSYLNTFIWQVKLMLILMVYLFTILIPTLLIYHYRRYHGWTPIQLGQRERRMMPYIIYIFSYLVCLYIMDLIHLPHLITSMIMASLVIQIICSIINVWWKISTHTAGIGGVIGAIIAFSFILNFNPISWLCVAIIFSGIVGSSRIILRQHSLTEVTSGLFIGIICAFLTITLM